MDKPFHSAYGRPTSGATTYVASSKCCITQWGGGVGSAQIIVTTVHGPTLLSLYGVGGCDILIIKKRYVTLDWPLMLKLHNKHLII